MGRGGPIRVVLRFRKCTNFYGLLGRGVLRNGPRRLALLSSIVDFYIQFADIW